MEILGYKFEEGLFYDSDHDWARDDGEVITVGVTDFFQKTAGEIIFIEIPRVGRVVEKGQPYSSIESGKWVGRLKAPVNGDIVAVNGELDACPYLLNDSPYDEGWIIKIKPADKGELKELYNASDRLEEFKTFLAVEDEKIKAGKKA